LQVLRKLSKAQKNPHFFLKSFYLLGALASSRFD